MLAASRVVLIEGPRSNGFTASSGIKNSGQRQELSKDGLRFFEACERLGPIVHARAYHKRFYVVTDPDLIEEILVKNAKSFGKPELLRGLKMIFGESLLTSDRRSRGSTVAGWFNQSFIPSDKPHTRRSLAKESPRCWRAGNPAPWTCTQSWSPYASRT